MPYSSNSELPDYVKKLSDSKQSQWREVFNSCSKEGKPEETCFKMANGTVEKAYISSLWDVDVRQLSQEQAGYNPIGMSSEKACANCNWFVPTDNACVLVSGDILPTGVSDHWIAKPVYEEKPMPVTIVKEDKPSLVKEIGAAFSSLYRSLLPKPSTPTTSGIKLYKQADGSLRFFAMYSNNFKDKHNEIIAESAHLDYINWAYEKQTFPDLILWHTPQTAFGKVDWLDYSSGFVLASGTINKGQEALAEKLATKEMGLSHGFVGVPNNGVFEWYRTFEISVLPLAHAANQWTSFTVEKDNYMSFTPERKKFLMDQGVGEDTIKDWESESETLGKELEKLGHQRKSEQAVTTVDEIRSLTTAVTGLATSVATLVESQKSLEDSHKTLETNQKVLEEKLSKSFDEALDDRILAAVAKTPGGHVASESNNNVLSDEAAKKELAKTEPTWFDNVVKSVSAG